MIGLLSFCPSVALERPLVVGGADGLLRHPRRRVLVLEHGKKIRVGPLGHELITLLGRHCAFVNGTAILRDGPAGKEELVEIHRAGLGDDNAVCRQPADTQIFELTDDVFDALEPQQHVASAAALLTSAVFGREEDLSFDWTPDQHCYFLC